ncbi:MAG: carboxypeptidase-like regulatory domain-containing protein [Acidobacteriota bacterium]
MKIMKIFFHFIILLILVLYQEAAFSQQYQDSEEIESLRVGSLNQDDQSFINDQSVPSAMSMPGSCLMVPVSVSLKNRELSDCLQTIAKKAGVKLVYNDALVDKGAIDLDVVDEPLKDVLNMVLSGHNLDFREYGNRQIVLVKKKAAALKSGIIKGVVRDEKGEGLLGANVVLLETGAGCATDLNGNYIIKNVKPGQYTIKASFVSYEPSVKNLSLGDGKTAEVDFILKPSAFQIGGIEVLGKTELLPTDVSTKTTISSGEIEHYQASSIKDVLDLVPGVQKTENPGIGKTGQVAVRGDDTDQLSALGTLVVIDGSPVSNNANLQFETMHNVNTGGSNMGGGVDLRTIPADNIESIEIITGLPSVRYGDVTEGVINIKTKSGYQPNRLKLKNNPDTREANLGGGFNLGESSLSYNFNVARSERDLRLKGDEYTRVTGQSIYSTSLFENQFTLNHKINGQMIFDEEQPMGDIYKTKNYNRGFSLGYSSWGKYTFDNGTSSFEYNANVDFKKVNSMKSRLVSALLALANGDTISSYIGKVETRGNEWNVGGRLEYNKVLFTGDVVHNLLMGTEIQYDANTGEGVKLDSVLNYYGPESGERSYSFNDIPGQILTSLYAQDKMTWHLLFDYNLVFGMRYEMYRPFQFNAKGLWGDGDLIRSHQGSFLNPRVNFMVYFSKYNQLRLSAGTTSKSPAMSTLYKQPTYYAWRNPLDGKNYYYKFNLRVPELKGYREAQFEAAYDHKFFNFLGTTVSAYYKERKNESESQSIPFIKALNDNGVTKAYFITSYSLPQNLGWTISKGLEFALRTNKIKALNMYFEVTGSYNRNNTGKGGLKYDFSPDVSKGQIPNYKPSLTGVDTLMAFTYQPGTSWRDRFQINYYMKYTLPPLGLWVTLRAEEVVFENSQTLDTEYEDYSKLSESDKLTYDFLREVKHKTPKWLFNLSISKSLSKNTEISFYVNNFLDDPAIFRTHTSPTTISESARNPDLFYGIEFSCILDDLFSRSGK